MPKWIRAVLTVGAAIAVVGITACEPTQISSSDGPRGSVIEVTSTGCDGWAPAVEATLIVAVDGVDTVAARADGVTTARLIVPDWAPLGPAKVTSRCLEAYSSHDTGPNWTVSRRYAWSRYTITDGGTGPDGTVTVDHSPEEPVGEFIDMSGTGCDGQVELAAVPLHTGMLASSSSFFYGSRGIAAAGNGEWVGGARVSYSSDMIWDFVRPGPLTIGATCHTPQGSWSYPPATTVIGAPTARPSVHLREGADVAQVGQCLFNDLSVTRTATMGGGEVIVESKSEVGRFRAHQFHFTPTPGAVSVTVEASCAGPFHESFDYEPASWAV